MKPVLLTLLIATVPAPALAQHAGHDRSGVPTPAQAQASAQARPQPADPHAGHGQATPQPDPHAGHQMPQPPQAAPADPGHATPPAAQTADPHAGHRMPQAQQADPHQGHDMGAMQPAADPHAGHDMRAMAAPAPPVGPPPREAFSGPAHAADTVFDPAAMNAAREALRAEHGAGTRSRFTIDQLELAMRNGRDGYSWEDVQFWYGGDLNRLWLKSEGEGTFGDGLESAEVQALWSRAISPFWDLQAGLRYDFRPRPDRGYLVLGLQGLAPHWFEVDVAAFLSDRGDITARAEAEYDQRLTQHLILQPRVEANFSLQDVPELRLGSGVTSGEAGLRLRYELVPEFAPYVGVQYERAFGDTADFRRAGGDDVGDWSFVLGLRAWF